MEYLEGETCRLCLNSFGDKNFHVLDGVKKYILDVFQLKLDFDDGQKETVCNVCTQKLQDAFEFKFTCLSTNVAIMPYIGIEKPFPVDLKEVYKEKNGVDVLVLHKQKICLLCMQIVKDEFTSIHKLEVDMFQKLIPEINFSATKYPIICKICLDTLVKHNSFIENCFEVDKRIKNTLNENSQLLALVWNSCIKSECNEQNGKVKTDAEDIQRNLKETKEKLEEEKVKAEVNTEEIKRNLKETEEKLEKEKVKIEVDTEEFQRNLKESEEKIKTEVGTEEIQRNLKETEKELEEEEDAFIKTEEIEIKDECIKQRMPSIHCPVELHEFRRVTRNRSSFSVKKNLSDDVEHPLNENFDYKIPNTKKVKSNINTPKICSSVDLHKYNSFSCKRKRFSDRKQLQNNSKIRWYQCNKCDYRSKLKGNLKIHILNHMLIHKNSELQWYKCDICVYKSTRRGHFAAHMLTHKNSSEIQWHKCDICEYKAKQKSTLKRHMVVHKDSSEIKWFVCDACDYKCKRKSCLKRHMLKHKDSSEIRWFECDICDYKTIEKSEFESHVLTHRYSSEIPWFVCDKCDYKAKRKSHLKSHMLIHKDCSKIQWFACEVCDYKSKQKSHLKRHMLIHNGFSEIK